MSNSKSTKELIKEGMRDYFAPLKYKWAWLCIFVIAIILWAIGNK